MKWPFSTLSALSSLSGKRHNSINTENYKQAHKVEKEEVGQHNFVDTIGDENAEKVEHKETIPAINIVQNDHTEKFESD